MAASSPETVEVAPSASELRITGMNCASCAQQVAAALQGVPGVAGADVSLPEERARIRWRADVSHDDSVLIAAVKEAGYGAEPVSPQDKPKPQGLLAGWRFNMAIGLAGTVPLMAGEWLFGWNGQPWFAWVSFGLALTVQALCGARFYRGAWRQLRSGGSNMDTLVALGSTTAFGYSAWVLFSGVGGHLYFMEAAAIITLISIGHWMEERAGSYAEKSLRALFHLAPEMAQRQNADGSADEVAVASLERGDKVLLRPGARVPTDGKVLEGQGSVDEAMLTGESQAVEKEIGGNLYAGTVNLNGRMVMEVTGIGEDTAVAHIIAAVERAQNSRANIQRLADRISNVFVPIVVVVAIAAGLWWGLAFQQAQRLNGFLTHFLWAAHMPSSALAAGVLSAVAVLIVACPCAMGLATPVAIMAGTNAAAKRGILIRDGVALEKAGRLTAVLADKTGTLTVGRPEVVASHLLSNAGNELKIAAALARGSDHPLSRAVGKMSAEEVTLSQWREVRGAGVEAQWARGPGKVALARLGSLPWLIRCGVDVAPGAEFAEKWMASGATILGFSLDRQCRAWIALQDAPKPGAKEVVQKITRMGLKVFLVTGDNRRTAEAVASQTGIAPDHVFAEVAPENKAELVRELQQKGERIAFVGDGINDAPALEQADLGIAVSEASDVANEASDIILLQSDIRAIPEAIEMAQATLRTIKQNLFWAFFYNVAAIPLAAAGLLSPILCAAAMGLSDLVVIGNAVRLRRFGKGLKRVGIDRV